MNRAYSTFTVRSLDNDQRIIEGIASTPRVDRAFDVVEPLGAEWELPCPFLLDHAHEAAIGEVEVAEATARGIRFRARVFKPTEGAAKELCDRGWSLIRSGLRKYVSIGFRALDVESLPGGGSRFVQWELLEISAVSIPANPDARIETVKSRRTARQSLPVVRLDDPISGRRSLPVVRLNEPVGLRRSLPVVRLADPVSARRNLPVVRLEPEFLARARIRAESAKRIEAKKRLGITDLPVRLSAEDLVDGTIAAARARHRRVKI